MKLGKFPNLPYFVNSNIYLNGIYKFHFQFSILILHPIYPKLCISCPSRYNIELLDKIYSIYFKLFINNYLSSNTNENENVKQKIQQTSNSLDKEKLESETLIDWLVQMEAELPKLFTHSKQ